MLKIRKINRSVNPFSGINFCIDEIRKARIPELIDYLLPPRPKQSTYSYSDVILGLIYANLCGSERLEDIKKIKDEFRGIPDLHIPSPDTIANTLKFLSSETVDVTSDSDIEHQFNLNEPLNMLLLKIVTRLNILNKSKNVLDYDNVTIPTEKYDSKFTYKQFRGYSPGVAFIGQLPVFIEGRNGNSPAAYKMVDTLKRCLKELDQQNIPIKRFRSDSAAFQKSVMLLMDNKGIEFFIRAQENESIGASYSTVEWKPVVINGERFEVGSIKYSPIDVSRVYRLVVYKCLDRENKETNRHTGDNYSVLSIITNDWKMSNTEIIKFYDQRGAAEKNFSMLLNDFNWKRMPFSFLSQNVTFLVTEAIASVIYRHVINTISKKVSFVNRTFQLKKFIFQFISVAGYWTYEGGEFILNLHTDRKYQQGEPPG